jgi:hypothetical protein
MEGATAPEQIRLEKPATPDIPPSKPARMNWVEMMNYYMTVTWMYIYIE